MSVTEQQGEQPRKSARARKSVVRFGNATTAAMSSKKDRDIKKRAAAGDDADDAPISEDDDDDNDDEAEEDEDEDEDDEVDDEDDEPSYQAPGSRRPRRSNAGASSSSPASGSARKRRATTARRQQSISGSKKTAATRAKGKKKGAAEDGDEPAAAAHEGGKQQETVVNDDNELFNAVKDPDSSLEVTVDDWLESYEKDAGPAMAELVNCILRSCGCNSSVDEHQAEDEDGIVDVLDDIQADFKKATMLAYPLVSKAKGLKKLRSSLESFVSGLFEHAASSDALYSTDLCQHLQAWIVSLSSSKVRAFRHTATVWALLAIGAISDLLVANKKELTTATRARDAEDKKARQNKDRLKALQAQLKATNDRRESLEEYARELVDGVFVHRYRDSEPVIRVECVRALAGWMNSNPQHWLAGTYLRYIGWLFADAIPSVRLEAVKALPPLFAKQDFVGATAHFAERFKAQLVRMALGEIDAHVRTAAVKALDALDKNGILDDDQRDELAQLVFHDERRTRAAIAPFFASLVNESLEQQQKVFKAAQGGASKKGKSRKRKAASDEGQDEEAADEEDEEEIDKDEEAKRLEFKIIASMLLKYAAQLDERFEASEDADESAVTEHELAVERARRGRVAFAVDALWAECEVLQDWEALMRFLLIDHSAAGGDASGETTPRAKGKGRAGVDEDPTRLDDAEETLLVEVLVAVVEKTVKPSASSSSKKDKEAEEDVKNDVTRAMIRALPKLFAKHQTSPIRMVDVLGLPRLLNLDLYVDMDMVSAYESLWDDVSKQLLKHSSADVIDAAVSAIRLLLATTSLSTRNEAKALELEESLAEALADSTGLVDLEMGSFEDDIPAIQACLARIAKLAAQRDPAAILAREDATGKAVSAAVDAIVGRADFGYPEESKMVEAALSVRVTAFIWSMRNVMADADAGVDEVADQRMALVDKLEEIALGTRSNALATVKQAALAHLLDLMILLKSIGLRESRLRGLDVPFSDELEARCAGFVQSEIERFSDEVVGEQADAPASDSEGSDHSDEDAEPKSRKTAAKGKSKANAPPAKEDKDTATKMREQLRKLRMSESFQRLISRFARAITAGVVGNDNAGAIMAMTGRLGPFMDSLSRYLANHLRDEWRQTPSKSDTVAKVLRDSLQSAFDNFLSASAPEAHQKSLSDLVKIIVSALIVRGSHLAIVRRIEPSSLINLHSGALTHALGKVKSYDEQKRKQHKARALFMFKLLSAMLIGVDGRDALAIKAKLDAVVRDNDLSIPASAQAWEPLRAYQKRLTNLMSKDSSIKEAAKAKTRQASPEAAQVAATAAGSDAESEVGEPETSRPRARRVQKADVADDESDAASEQREATEAPMDEDEEDEVAELLLGSSQKRTHSQIDDEVHDEAEDAPIDEDAQSVASLSDIKPRAKRARI